MPERDVWENFPEWQLFIKQMCGGHSTVWHVASMPNEAKSILHNKVGVAEAGGTILHPSEEKAASPDRLQLAMGKTTLQDLLLQPKIFYSPQYEVWLVWNGCL